MMCYVFIEKVPSILASLYDCFYVCKHIVRQKRVRHHYNKGAREMLNKGVWCGLLQDIYCKMSFRQHLPDCRLQGTKDPCKRGMGKSTSDLILDALTLQSRQEGAK